jgi:hypothetical protein
MNEHDQRIAIAEACGWVGLHKRNSNFRRSETGTTLAGRHPDLDGCPTLDGWSNSNEVPDYCNDLNAMHEAEKTLTLDQRRTYWNRLCLVTEKGRMAEASWLTTTATAAQRAEAFLKTIGKWKSE